MSIAERRIALLKIIKERKHISVNELAEHFDVSSMTIRRDLSKFEAQGTIVMTHGSVSLNTDMYVEPSFSEKLGKQLDTKEKIAKRAASLVNDGDTIILDCGTTVLQMLKYLQDKKITIFTNSYPVVQHLSGNTKITLYMAPGKYSEISAGFFGEMTIHFFNQIHCDKVFMATHGYDDKYGASVPEVEDAQTKKALMQAASTKYLLFEDEKRDTIYTGIFGKKEEFDLLITE